MTMRRYLKIDEHGNILRDILTSIEYTDPSYIQIPRAMSGVLSQGLDKVRWNGTQLIQKEEIRLVVGSTQIPADGVTTCAICVRGDNLGDTEEVSILINGEPEIITKLNHLELYTDEPGQFLIQLNDINYTARPSQYTIIAYTPEIEEPVEE